MLKKATYHEAQLLNIDMKAYHQDYNNPFTGYSMVDISGAKRIEPGCRFILPAEAYLDSIPI